MQQPLARVHSTGNRIYRTATWLAQIVCLLSCIGVSWSATVPGTLSYQGKVLINGAPVTTGAYPFKFALVDAAGTTTYWSNDGLATPSATVSVTVTNGLYSVLLGDTTITNILNP